MTAPTSVRAIAAVLFALSALLMAACTDEDAGMEENLPPTVWLVSAPPEGDSTSYRVHMEWGGSDPDGSIAYYEFAITDNERGAFAPADTIGPGPWHKVYGEDSLFLFTADEPADPNPDEPVSRFQRSHTFFIRAVDDRGLPSEDPAYRSFTAWTLSPEATITIPRYIGFTPALMPPVGTYHWRATDYITSTLEVQQPDSVRWILLPAEGGDFAATIDYIRDNVYSDEWYPWVHYGVPDEAGRSWTTPPLSTGPYVFAIQAKDEAGAVTPVFDEARNVRRVRVSVSSTGPLLEVYNELIGTIRTSIDNTPLVIADMPSGLPVSFEFSASADAYGGVVTAYRYGWDVIDVDEPDQWEIDYTPFSGPVATSPPRTFYFGAHTFTVEVIDNQGRTSRAEVKINYVPFTMSRDLLLVDDFDLQSDGIDHTNGAVPSDAEHDAFWQAVLGDAAGFSFARDAFSVSDGTPLTISDIADYKTIVWDAYGGYNISLALRPRLYDLIHFRSRQTPLAGKVVPNLLALFMRMGGHLMLCGNQPMTQSIPDGPVPATEKYPFVFRYELEGDQDGHYSGQFAGEASFPYRDACLNVLDIAYPGVANLRMDDVNECGVRGFHGTDPLANGLREVLPADPAFPLLELRDEAAGAGRYYAPDRRGLNAELYNPSYFATCPFAELDPSRGCFEPAYRHGCGDTQSVLYGAPVAFWSSAYAGVVPEQGGGRPARSFFLGVEPYYFEPAQVKEMMDRILFDEWGLDRI